MMLVWANLDGKFARIPLHFYKIWICFLLVVSLRCIDRCRKRSRKAITEAPVVSLPHLASDERRKKKKKHLWSECRAECEAYQLIELWGYVLLVNVMCRRRTHEMHRINHVNGSQILIKKNLRTGWWFLSVADRHNYKGKTVIKMQVKAILSWR